MKRPPVFLRRLLPLLLVAGLAACTRSADAVPVAGTPAFPAVGPGTPPPAPQVAGTAPSGNLCLETVTIQGRKATPDKLTMKAPCRVLFTNRDPEPVQLQGPGFVLPEMNKDDSWVQTFAEPGTYAWVDVKSDTVKGVLILTP